MSFQATAVTFCGPMNVMLRTQARPFVDYERDGEPGFLVVELHLAADFALKEAQGAIIGGEPLHVFVDLLAIDVAVDQIQNWRAGLNHGAEPARAGNRVADELGAGDLLHGPFVELETPRGCRPD